MSNALRMSICIQEVEDVMKKLNDRKEICEIVVRALYSHASAEDRTNYYVCFQLNENVRNEEIKELGDKMIGLMHLLNNFFSTVAEP